MRGQFKSRTYSRLTIPKRQILDSSELKEFADDNFRFNESGGMFSKRVENTAGKEKLLVTSNFSFSNCVFKRFVLHTRKNQGLFGKGLCLNFIVCCIGCTLFQFECCFHIPYQKHKVI